MNNSFLIIPKELFKNEKYKKLSADAKLLYGIVRDRRSLSKKNNWLDENGEMFIVLSLDFVCEMIGCKKDKAQKLIKELINIELIKKIKQGRNCPCLYTFFDLHTEKTYAEENLHTEKSYTEILKNSIPEYGKTVSNKTEYNKTDFSNTFFVFEEEGEIRDGFKTMPASRR